MTQKELYNKALNDFAAKYGIAHVTTGSLVERSYTKIYHADCGKEFYEVNRIISEEWTEYVSRHGLRTAVTCTADYFVTEYWDSDNAKSRYVWETL